MGSIVKRGSKGGHIIPLNAALYNKGFKKVPDPSDPNAASEFTAETEKAVKAIQKRYGVRPTGVCDVNGMLFALGKSPKDFLANPHDFTSVSDKYSKKQDEHGKRADRLVKDISDEMRALKDRVSRFKDNFGEAITNDFVHAVQVLEADWDMYQTSNDLLERFRLVQSMKKWEKKAAAAQSRADQEVAIAVKYIKSLEGVLKQLKGAGH
ncbi:hypothetical protein Z946_794 [Sulfitobacter noctilucicola]|uniref:Peptidoglycan hydrolase-like protein with peptidoglycan-binding domain n=1 Tax=Sulfitobacter noctilucicola TaxID=1342301 RepID=A0A7W6M8S9_9RHOB|nr:peptidoglycan-binding protein [Sulfitobacter noctilucicola]KIN61938.1 hypothetical protein Z946_794 [Sulfitobacter noctilucicola]MBB4173541.1 peptidoglycan hydrolase-like protein with peptidoglycan-binding domain [Sulfitobacter noctilucicola]